MIDLVYTIAIVFILTVIAGPVIIPLLHKVKFGQTVRDDGPATHLKKSGTPTMGGIIFIIAAVIAIIRADAFDMDLKAAFLLFFGHALLGFIDDYIKVVLKRSLGLRAKQKIIGQVILAILFIIISNNVYGKITIPVVNISFDVGYWYAPFIVILIIATTNAVNLTDGLDGLAAGVTLIVLLAYVFIAYMLGSTSLAGFSAALAGGCLGFLVFNFHPARIFMGDTGSLALGGAIAALAVLTHTELILPVIGGIYVIEALSVILQVISFKTTGKRLFRMSPIHHHFELLGWSEVKVVSFFYFWAMLFTILGVYLLSK